MKKLSQYEEFSNLMKKNDLNNIDFKKKINKTYFVYYVYYSINENNNIDNPTLKKQFYDITKLNLD